MTKACKHCWHDAGEGDCEEMDETEHADHGPCPRGIDPEAFYSKNARDQFICCWCGKKEWREQ